MDQNNTNYTYEEVPPAPPRKHTLWALIPKGDYFFTPIILNVNILVFVAMVISGASPWLPGGDVMVKWGANVHGLTMNGQYWRLFTSMFLHFGIFHLGFNMMALFSIGRILEPFIGKYRFLVFYLLTGLTASVISNWWHASDSVSAGASGAILGIVGVLAALLTTNLIVKEVRKSLLKSLGISLALTMLIGLNSSIDNSAHIGGILSGAICGYFSYFDLKSFYQRRVKKYSGLIVASLLTSAIIVFVWIITPKNSVTTKTANEILFNRYQEEEKNSIAYIDKMDSTASAEDIQKNVLQPWQHNLQLVDSMMANGLTTEGEKAFKQLKIYTLYRLKGADEIYRSKKDHRKDLMDSAKVSMHAADNVAKEPIEGGGNQ